MKTIERCPKCKSKAFIFVEMERLARGRLRDRLECEDCYHRWWSLSYHPEELEMNK